MNSPGIAHPCVVEPINFPQGGSLLEELGPFNLISVTFFPLCMMCACKGWNFIFIDTHMCMIYTYIYRYRCVWSRLVQLEWTYEDTDTYAETYKGTNKQV